MVKSAIEINAPTIEKYRMPKSNGAKERMLEIADTALIGVRSFLFDIMEIIIKIIKTQVKSATMNGEKFAYPNGVKSK